MTDYAGCAMEELEKFVMPALLVATADDAAMVAVTNKGYAITHRGLEELDKRGIPHRGEEVVTEGGHHLDFGNWNPEDFGDNRKPDSLRSPSTTPPAAKITPDSRARPREEHRGGDAGA